MFEIEGCYVNASKLCIAFGKRFCHYQRTRSATAFLHALAKELDTEAKNLVWPGTPGRGNIQGTFVHPAIALHLISWLCPQVNARLLLGLTRQVSVKQVKRIVEPPEITHTYSSGDDH